MSCRLYLCFMTITKQHWFNTTCYLNSWTCLAPALERPVPPPVSPWSPGPLVCGTVHPGPPSSWMWMNGADRGPHSNPDPGLDQFGKCRHEAAAAAAVGADGADGGSCWSAERWDVPAASPASTTDLCLMVPTFVWQMEQHENLVQMKSIIDLFKSLTFLELSMKKFQSFLVSCSFNRCLRASDFQMWILVV